MKIMELIFAIGGAVAFGGSCVLNLWLWKAMPTQPDTVRGFIIQMINHGRTIYLNAFFYTIYRCLFWGGLALFLIAALIDFYKDPFNWRGMRR